MQANVKLPATEILSAIESCGLSDAAGVRTHAPVYYPGGSPNFLIKAPRKILRKPPPPPAPRDCLLGPEVQIAASEDSR